MTRTTTTPMGVKKTAMITGASGGIGLDLAWLFARDGHDVVLVARSEGKLRELGEALTREYGVQCTTISIDLSAPGAAAQVMQQLAARGVELDALVNNAGYGLFGAFTDTDLDAELKMIQLNIGTLTHLSKLVLPGMIARRRGRILNVASTAAFQPGPLMAVYYASKAYVLSFSEALANETRGTGVTVTALCPGPTRSGFQSAAQLEGSKLVSDAGSLMTSEAVAQIGYTGMQKGRSVVVPGARNSILANLVRFLPRETVTRMVRKAQERVDA